MVRAMEAVGLQPSEGYRLPVGVLLDLLTIRRQEAKGSGADDTEEDS